MVECSNKYICGHNRTGDASPADVHHIELRFIFTHRGISMANRRARHNLVLLKKGRLDSTIQSTNGTEDIGNLLRRDNGDLTAYTWADGAGRQV